MKEVLQTILAALVENKEEIHIEEIEKQRETVYEVRVAKSDMGRVIGKEGRIAKAIRTLFKAVSAREQKKVTIEFID